MKKVIFLILLFSVNIYASKYCEGRVVMKDKTEMIGLVDLAKETSINFKTDKYSKKIVIEAEKIDKIYTIYNNQNINKYEFHLVSTRGLIGNKERIRLLQVLHEGKVILYQLAESFSYNSIYGAYNINFFLKKKRRNKTFIFCCIWIYCKTRF